MNQKKIKRLIIVLVLILIVILSFIIYFVKVQYDNGKENSNEVAKNNMIDDENSTSNNNDINSRINNTGNMLYDEEEDLPDWEETSTIPEEELVLKKDQDKYTYLLMKQCMEIFYGSAENALNVIDTDAIQTLGINEGNISNVYGNIENPRFSIDEIYKQRVTLSKELYLIFYRVQRDNNSFNNLAMIVKLERKNVTFSIYPYQYLRQNDYLNLGENDVITINNMVDVEENNYNKFNVSTLSRDDETTTLELYEKYKFDLLFDIDHLYNSLDNEYKNLKFENRNSFNEYINNNYGALVQDEVKKYLATESDGGAIQYVAVGNNSNYYIFNYTSFMEYSLILDDYIVLSQQMLKVYNSSMDDVQTKYCMDRIKKAINNQDYKFVYEKLNSVQRGNYYSNYNDFVNFIKTNFYEKNDFEYGKYMIIADNVYQYKVRVSDANIENSLVYKEFNMSITLKDNSDFAISITKSE